MSCVSFASFCLRLAVVSLHHHWDVVAAPGGHHRRLHHVKWRHNGRTHAFDWDIHVQVLKVQPRGRGRPVWGSQDHFVGLIRLRPPVGVSCCSEVIKVSSDTGPS